MYIYVHLYISIYIYLFIFIYIYIFIYLLDKKKRKCNGKTCDDIGMNFILKRKNLWSKNVKVILEEDSDVGNEKNIVKNFYESSCIMREKELLCFKDEEEEIKELMSRKHIEQPFVDSDYESEESNSSESSDDDENNIGICP